MPSPTTRGATGARPQAFAWFRELGGHGRRAFFGAFGGYALDSYDFQVLPLAMAALAATFNLSTGQTGLLATVTLVVSAIGGAFAGYLADRIGRVRTLILTVLIYAVCTTLCGFAPNYPTLLVLRGLQGLGFGGVSGPPVPSSLPNTRQHVTAAAPSPTSRAPGQWAGPPQCSPTHWCSHW